MSDLNLKYPCKFGHVERFGVNSWLICSKGNPCPKYRYKSCCGHYVMNDNYTECKNYKINEMEYQENKAKEK